MEWKSEFDRFTGDYSECQDSLGQGSEPVSFIKVIDSDIGRKVDFKRVAVHQIILPPGCRSSMPHAESHEREFVFVSD